MSRVGVLCVFNDFSVEMRALQVVQRVCHQSDLVLPTACVP